MTLVILIVLGIPIWLIARVSARNRLAEVLNRLSALESEVARLKLEKGSPQPVELQSSRPSQPTTVTPAPVTPAPVTPPTPISAAPQTSVSWPPPPPAFTSPPAFKPPPLPIPKIDWEQFVGVKGFAWIGGLALFLGVVFFVKYSFDNNLVPPVLRVTIGFLAGLGLLEDDTIPAVRSWIGRRTGDLPPGFDTVVRDWLLVLLDGAPRSRPRSATTIYVYFTAVHPLISRWPADRGHLREVTTQDIRAGLDNLRGHRLHTTISAVRSLFRFARKRGLIFASPAQRLKAGVPGPSLLPMTEDEIRAVEQAITLPGQRLIVALAAVHAARWEAIRDLTLDDLDLPSRRITIAGHPQRLGDLSHEALRAWLDHRRATWPHTPNRHVLISEKTALGDGPVTRGYLDFHLKPHGVSVERIRRDRILHEALTGRPDPLHLSLLFGISERPASQYARIARDILAEPPGPGEGTQHDLGERE